MDKDHEEDSVVVVAKYDSFNMTTSLSGKEVASDSKGSCEEDAMEDEEGRQRTAAEAAALGVRGGRVGSGHGGGSGPHDGSKGERRRRPQPAVSPTRIDGDIDVATTKPTGDGGAGEVQAAQQQQEQQQQQQQQQQQPQQLGQPTAALLETPVRQQRMCVVPIGDRTGGAASGGGTPRITWWGMGPSQSPSRWTAGVSGLVQYLVSPAKQQQLQQPATTAAAQRGHGGGAAQVLILRGMLVPLAAAVETTKAAQRRHRHPIITTDSGGSSSSDSRCKDPDYQPSSDGSVKGCDGGSGGAGPNGSSHGCSSSDGTASSDGIVAAGGGGGGVDSDSDGGGGGPAKQRQQTVLDHDGSCAPCTTDSASTDGGALPAYVPQQQQRRQQQRRQQGQGVARKRLVKNGWRETRKRTHRLFGLPVALARAHRRAVSTLSATIRVTALNLRSGGLTSHSGDVAKLGRLTGSDILLLSETHLPPGGMTKVPGYWLHAQPRGGPQAGLRARGGVAIAVRWADDSPVMETKMLEVYSRADVIWASVTVKGWARPLAVCAVYLPPAEQAGKRGQDGPTTCSDDACDEPRCSRAHVMPALQYIAVTAAALQHTHDVYVAGDFNVQAQKTAPVTARWRAVQQTLLQAEQATAAAAAADAGGGGGGGRTAHSTTLTAEQLVGRPAWPFSLLNPQAAGGGGLAHTRVDRSMTTPPSCLDLALWLTANASAEPVATQVACDCGLDAAAAATHWMDHHPITTTIRGVVAVAEDEDGSDDSSCLDDDADSDAVGHGGGGRGRRRPSRRYGLESTVAVHLRRGQGYLKAVSLDEETTSQFQRQLKSKLAQAGLVSELKATVSGLKAAAVVSALPAQASTLATAAQQGNGGQRRAYGPVEVALHRLEVLVAQAARETVPRQDLDLAAVTKQHRTTLRRLQACLAAMSGGGAVALSATLQAEATALQAQLTVLDRAKRAAAHATRDLSQAARAQQLDATWLANQPAGLQACRWQILQADAALKRHRPVPIDLRRVQKQLHSLQEQAWGHYNVQSPMVMADCDVPTAAELAGGGGGIDAKLPTLEEVHRAIGHLRGAASAIGIPIAVFKALDAVAVEALMYVLHQVWLTGAVPAEWALSRVKLVHKTGPLDDLSSHRVIAIGTVASRVWQNVLQARWTRSLPAQMFDKQYGFLPRKSTEHASSLVRARIAVARAEGADLYGVFVDIKKAYSTMQLALVGQAMRQFAICPWERRMVLHWLQQQQLFLQRGKLTSEPVESNVGSPEGAVLSPLLFLMALHPVLVAVQARAQQYERDKRRRLTIAAEAAAAAASGEHDGGANSSSSAVTAAAAWTTSEGSSSSSSAADGAAADAAQSDSDTVAYADDVVLTANEQSKLEAMAAELEKQLTARRWELNVAATKTAAMWLSGRRPTAAEQRRLKYQHTHIPWVDSYKHLGITITSAALGYVGAQQERARTLAQRMAWATRAMVESTAAKHSIFHSVSAMQTYHTPAITWGMAFTWVTAPPAQMVKHRHLQLRIILGVGCGYPNVALRVIAGVPSLDTVLEREQLRVFLRMMQQPPGCPIRRALAHEARVYFATAGQPDADRCAARVVPHMAIHGVMRLMQLFDAARPAVEHVEPFTPVEGWVAWARALVCDPFKDNGIPLAQPTRALCQRMLCHIDNLRRWLELKRLPSLTHTIELLDTPSLLPFVTERRTAANRIRVQALAGVLQLFGREWRRLEYCPLCTEGAWSVPHLFRDCLQTETQRRQAWSEAFNVAKASGIMNMHSVPDNRERWYRLMMGASVPDYFVRLQLDAPTHFARGEGQPATRHLRNALPQYRHILGITGAYLVSTVALVRQKLASMTVPDITDRSKRAGAVTRTALLQALQTHKYVQPEPPKYRVRRAKRQQDRQGGVDDPLEELDSGDPFDMDLDEYMEGSSDEDAHYGADFEWEL